MWWAILLTSCEEFKWLSVSFPAVMSMFVLWSTDRNVAIVMWSQMSLWRPDIGWFETRFLPNELVLCSKFLNFIELKTDSKSLIRVVVEQLQFAASKCNLDMKYNNPPPYYFVAINIFAWQRKMPAKIHPVFLTSLPRYLERMCV